jgi:polyisoprenoid-binding protein YceI
MGSQSGMNGCNPHLVMPRWLLLAPLISVLFLNAETLRAQEMTLELDPANTGIEFTLAATLHTMHGTFALKRGTIRFNPSSGAASGLVVVNATGGDSGNTGRDHKLHTQILESQRYPETTFTPTKMSGEVGLQGDSDAQVEGTLKLHGNGHAVTLTFHLQMKGNGIGARTHFVIPYIGWGLKNPSTLLLHVSDKVEFDVTTVGQVLEQGKRPLNSRQGVSLVLCTYRKKSLPRKI